MGEPLSTILVGVASIGMAVLIATKQRNDRRRFMRELVEKTGLTLHRGTLFLKDDTVDGDLANCHVALSWFTHGRHDSRRPKVKVTPRAGRVPFGLQIRKEDALGQIGKMLLGQDIRIGDPDFDGRFLIRGLDEVGVISVLGHRTRQLINDLVGEDGWRLGEDGLTWMSARKRPAATSLAETIQRADQVCLEIGRSGSSSERLVESLRNDPVPEFRLRCLEMLLIQPRSDAITSAIRMSARDDNPEVRLLAGESLGEEGIDTIARVALEAETKSAVRAIRALEKRPSESVAVQLRRVLGRKDTEPFAAAAEALAQMRDLPGVDIIVGVLGDASARSTSQRVAAARALRLYGLAQVCPQLLAALATGDRSLKIAVIEALGACGGSEEAGVLYGIKEADEDGVTRRAATQALAEIQSRLGAVARGSLSMAQAGRAEGGLSVADAAEPGSLSVDKIPDDGTS